MTAARAAYDAIVIGGGHNGLVCAAYLARPGCGRRRWSGASVSAAWPRPRSSCPASASRPLAHTVGRLRPSVIARPAPARAWPALVQPGGPRVRAAAGRPRVRRSGATRHGPPRRSATGGRTRCRGVPGVRRARPRTRRGSWRELGVADAAGPAPAGARRRARAGCGCGAGFRGLGRDDGRALLRVAADGRRGLRGGRVRDRRAPGGDRGARHPVHGDGRRGRRARPRCCSRTPPGTTAARPARRSFARGGPGALAEALAAAAGPRGARSGRAPRSSRIDSRDGRADRRRARLGRGARRRPSSSRRVDPKRTADAASSTRWSSGRASRWRAGTSACRASSPRSTSRLPGCRASRRRRR